MGLSDGQNLAADRQRVNHLRTLRVELVC